MSEIMKIRDKRERQINKQTNKKTERRKGVAQVIVKM